MALIEELDVVTRESFGVDFKGYQQPTEQLKDDKRRRSRSFTSLFGARAPPGNAAAQQQQQQPARPQRPRSNSLREFFGAVVGAVVSSKSRPWSPENRASRSRGDARNGAARSTGLGSHGTPRSRSRSRGGSQSPGHAAHGPGSSGLRRARALSTGAGPSPGASTRGRAGSIGRASPGHGQHALPPGHGHISPGMSGQPPPPQIGMPAELLDKQRRLQMVVAMHKQNLAQPAARSSARSLAGAFADEATDYGPVRGLPGVLDAPGGCSALPYDNFDNILAR